MGGTVTLIRDSNGDYSGDYPLSGVFAQAGEGLPPGSEVVFRGVQVGRVSSAALQGDEAKVTVLINPSFEVPRDATATIEPVNLFGADEVSLTTPGHDAEAGPYLAHGGVVRAHRQLRRAGRSLRRGHPAPAEDQHQQPLDGPRRARSGQPG